MRQNRRYKVLRLFNFTGHSVHLDNTVVLVLPAHCHNTNASIFVTALFVRQNCARRSEPCGESLQKITAFRKRKCRTQRWRWHPFPVSPARPPLWGRPRQPTAVPGEIAEQERPRCLVFRADKAQPDQEHPHRELVVRDGAFSGDHPLLALCHVADTDNQLSVSIDLALQPI